MIKFINKKDELDDGTFKEYKTDYPSLEEMRQGREKIIELRKNMWKYEKLKVVFGYENGKTDRMVIVSDSKEFDRAKTFCENKKMVPLSNYDFQMILGIIDNMINGREKAEMAVETQNREEKMTMEETKFTEIKDEAQGVEENAQGSFKDENALMDSLLANYDKAVPIAAGDTEDEPEDVDTEDEITTESEELTDEVAEEAISEDEQESVNTTSEEEITQAVSNQTTANVTGSPKLPEITADTKEAVLIVREDNKVCMQVASNTATKRCEGCKIYIKDTKTNRPYIGSEKEMSIKRSRLMRSTEENIMNMLDDFDLGEPLTLDEKKLAFDRAKKFIETSRVRTEVGGSMNIVDAYMAVTEYLAAATKTEAKDKTLTVEKRKYYHGRQSEEIVGVRTKYLQEALDELDAGYKSRDFLAKISMLEKCLGIELEVHNLGRHGCGSSLEGVFVRYYQFRRVNLYNLDNSPEVA